MEERRGPPGQLEATVLSIDDRGYAVTKVQGVTGTVTFSLTNDVWREPEVPTVGSVVILQNLRHYAGGLRALRAQFKPVKLTE